MRRFFKEITVLGIFDLVLLKPMQIWIWLVNGYKNLGAKDVTVELLHADNHFFMCRAIGLHATSNCQM